MVSSTILNEHHQRQQERALYAHNVVTADSIWLLFTTKKFSNENESICTRAKSTMDLMVELKTFLGAPRPLYN